MGETEVPVAWQVAEAQSPTVTTERLRELAKHPALLVREAVAKREDLPDDVIAVLARDEEPSVRATAARRRPLPVVVVCQLWHDTEPEVREGLWRSASATE